MIRIGQINVPSIGVLEEHNFKEKVADVIKQAESGLEPSERETLDFKKELNIETVGDKIKIRKQFSAFANTGGALVIIGVEEKDTDDLVIVGIDSGSYPPNEDLTQILSASDKVRPPVTFRRRNTQYRDKELAVYQINEDPYGVEIYERGEWRMYQRLNDTTSLMSPLEKSRRRANPEKLPEELRVDIPLFKFWTPDYDSRPFLEWEIGNLREVMAWTRAGTTGPPIFIPLPSTGIQRYRSKKYFHRPQRSAGDDYEDMFELLIEIEKQIEDNRGVSFELWTVLNDVVNGCGRYHTSGGASRLRDRLLESHEKTGEIEFGWLLSTNSVDHLLSGKIFDNGNYYFQKEERLGVIPNNFPFVSINNDRVVCKPFPVREADFESYFNDEFEIADLGNWRTNNWRMKKGLGKNDPSDSELDPFPTALIQGYLSEKPRQRPETFRAQNGMTVTTLKEPEKINDLPAIISETSPLPAYLRSACTGLSDQNEIKLTGLQCETYQMGFLPSIPDIVLLSIEISANQYRNLRGPSDWDMN